MGKRLSDAQVAVGLRAVALSAEIVLRRLRRTDVLDAPASPAGPVVGETAGRWQSLARSGVQVARRGGDRARAGLAVGLDRWMSDRPGTDQWGRRDLDARIEWWLAHLGRSTAVLAAVPGLAGIAGEKVPVQELVSLAGQALLSCAIAGEHGIDDPDSRVLLLARAVLDRDVIVVDHDRREAAREATALTAGMDAGAVTARPAAVAHVLLGVGRAVQALRDELDERPRGHLGHRVVGKVPVVGAVGHYRGERRGLAVVAERSRAWCVEHRAAAAPGPSALQDPRR